MPLHRQRATMADTGAPTTSQVSTGVILAGSATLREAARRFLWSAWWWAACLGLLAAVPQTALAQETALPACVLPAADTDTGSVRALRNLPGVGMLIAASKGLFLARQVNGRLTVDPVGDRDIRDPVWLPDAPAGWVPILTSREEGLLARWVNNNLTMTPVRTLRRTPALHHLPGVGVLIGTDRGLFLAREASGDATLSKPLDPRYVSEFAPLPGGRVLIGHGSGFLLARAVGNELILDPVGNSDTGEVLEAAYLPNAGILIWTAKGLFLAREGDGKPTPVAGTGSVSNFAVSPGGWVAIEMDKELVVARAIKDEFVRARTDIKGSAIRLHDLPDGRALIGATNGGLALAREVGDQVIIEPLSNAGVSKMHDLPGAGVLIGTDEGLLILTREVNGKPSPVADTGSVRDLEVTPGGWARISAAKGPFLARTVKGKPLVGRLGNTNLSALQLRDVPGVGVLIGADKGLLLAREVDGKLIVEPIWNTETGVVNGLRDLSGVGMVIGAEKGLFRTVPTPLAHASVDIRNRKTLDDSPTNPEVTVRFQMAHACAPVADRLGLKVRVTPPGRKPANSDLVATPHPKIAEITLPELKVDKPGQWSFQLVATTGGIDRVVGEARTLTFSDAPWWERWWKWSAISFAVVLAVANVVLFALARRSAWAWRVATDDGWGTGVLRVATLLMSHVPQAQLWIIDRYFQRVRDQVQARPIRPFLSLPLTASDGRLQASADVVAPPWRGRRLWVQGGSGMGKTALFRTIVDGHFRDPDTAFAAYARWGCIVVAFAARDFTEGGDDKDDPAWVVNAVRSTLSSEGVSFANAALLQRFLESGTIAVAIDGLNEVDRTRAVAAFSQHFAEAPMMVTSQQPGGERFATWRLPDDIRAFTSELLRLYLPREQADAVMGRIAASGLKDAIGSGYDVRLLVDLVRAGRQDGELPVDRLGLYAAVIEAGWPDAAEEKRKEQQSDTAAAAWSMVSGRKPNEDKRRLRPDVDLPKTLLVALAEVPERDNRSVRIVRRVGAGAFEFVHDQMHAYLAARWFAQEGLTVAELRKMVADSTIWTQSLDARRTLWGFAAALLDSERLLALWARIEDEEAWDVLRRALKAEAERRGLPAPRRPEAGSAQEMGGVRQP